MISVIIPSYNCAEYLVRSVNSVLHQTFIDLEVIVIDDGSTDHTPQVMRSLCESDTRVRYFRQDNRGVSAARNTGLRLAKGDLIYFVDADDAILPDALRHAHDVLNSTGARIAASHFSSIPLSKTSDKSLLRLLNDVGNITLYSPEQFATEVFYQSGKPNHSPCAKLFDSSLFDGIDFPDGVIYEDLDTIPDIILKADSIAQFDAPDYLYTQRPGSITHLFNIHRADVLDVTRRLHERMALRSLTLQRAAADRRLSANFNILLLTLRRNRHNETAEERRQYRAIIRQCIKTIRLLRKDTLRNPNVRLKNKLAVLLSYLLFP